MKNIFSLITNHFGDISQFKDLHYLSPTFFIEKSFIKVDETKTLKIFILKKLLERMLVINLFASG